MGANEIKKGFDGYSFSKQDGYLYLNNIPFEIENKDKILKELDNFDVKSLQDFKYKLDLELIKIKDIGEANLKIKFYKELLEKLTLAINELRNTKEQLRPISNISNVAKQNNTLSKDKINESLKGFNDYNFSKKDDKLFLNDVSIEKENKSELIDMIKGFNSKVLGYFKKDLELEKKIINSVDNDVYLKYFKEINEKLDFYQEMIENINKSIKDIEDRIKEISKEDIKSVESNEVKETSKDVELEDNSNKENKMVSFKEIEKNLRTELNEVSERYDDKDLYNQMANNYKLVVNFENGKVDRMEKNSYLSQQDKNYNNVEYYSLPSYYDLSMFVDVDEDISLIDYIQNDYDSKFNDSGMSAIVNKENKMGNVFNLDNYIEGNSLYESYRELMENGVYSELFNSDINAKDFAMNFEYDGLDYDDFRESYKMFVDYNTNEFSMINIDEYNEEDLKENINYFDFPSVNELNNLDNFFYDNLSNKLEDGYIDNKYNNNSNVNDVNNEDDSIKIKLAYNTTNDEIIRALENDGFKGHLVENDYYRDYIDNTIYKARENFKSFNDYVNNENLYSANTNLELYNKVNFKFNEDGKIEDVLKDGVSFKDMDSITLNVPNDGLKESLLNKVSNESFEQTRPIFNMEEQARARIEEIANKLDSTEFDKFIRDNYDGSFTNLLSTLDINKDDKGNILDVKKDGVSFKDNDSLKENDREI